MPKQQSGQFKTESLDLPFNYLLLLNVKSLNLFCEVFNHLLGSFEDIFSVDLKHCHLQKTVFTEQSHNNHKTQLHGLLQSL